MKSLQSKVKSLLVGILLMLSISSFVLSGEMPEPFKLFKEQALMDGKHSGDDVMVMETIRGNEMGKDLVSYLILYNTKTKTLSFSKINCDACTVLFVHESEILPSYELIEFVASGGMGGVFDKVIRRESLDQGQAIERLKKFTTELVTFQNLFKNKRF